jgi:hypothetical protein
MKYNIHCRVSGGVMGTRESLLKSNGEIVVFDTKAVAEIEAARLNSAMNVPFAATNFHYKAVPCEE